MFWLVSLATKLLFPVVKDVIVEKVVHSETKTGKKVEVVEAKVNEKVWFKSKTLQGLAAVFVYAGVSLYMGWGVDAGTLSNLLNNSGDVFLMAAAVFAGWGRTKAIK